MTRTVCTLYAASESSEVRYLQEPEAGLTLLVRIQKQSIDRKRFNPTIGQMTHICTGNGIILLLMALATAPTFAQIRMETSGNVAVGTTVHSSYKLYVRYGGTSTGVKYAIRGVGDAGITRYGVSGTGQFGTTNYGIRGNAAYGTHNYGVFGEASYGSSSNWAGYFSGSVYATSTVTWSDGRLKSHTRLLDGSEMTNILMKLKPMAYQATSDPEYDHMGLPLGDQFGLIAQDIEIILPQLVTEVIQPPLFDEHGEEVSPAVTFKGINYIGIIPILISVIQDQQLRIESLEEMIQK